MVLEAVNEGLRGKLADTDTMDSREQRIPEEETYMSLYDSYGLKNPMMLIFRLNYACKLFIIVDVHLKNKYSMCT